LQIESETNGETTRFIMFYQDYFSQKDQETSMNLIIKNLIKIRF